MKQEIHPAAMAGIIAAVVILVALLGFKLITGGQNNAAAEAAYKHTLAVAPPSTGPVSTGGPADHPHGGGGYGGSGGGYGSSGGSYGTSGGGYGSSGGGYGSSGGGYGSSGGGYGSSGR